jgi:hypothetical protein
MKRAILLMAGCLSSICGLANGQDDVRFYEENGVTFRETRRVERRPVTTTEWEEKQRTVYRDRYVTEVRDSQRTVYVPVTEYYAEPRVHGWWNPFGRPYVAYHMKPLTRWETRVESVQRPQTVREVVPETEVVRVPKRTVAFEDREVIERVVVEPRGARQLSARPVTPSFRTAESVGGIRRIDNDPPRQGVTNRR